MLLRLLFKSNLEGTRELKKIYYVVIKTNDSWILQTNKTVCEVFNL